MAISSNEKNQITMIFFGKFICWIQNQKSKKIKIEFKSSNPCPQDPMINILVLTQSSFSDSAASWNLGSLNYIKISNIRTLLTQPVLSVSTTYDHRSHPWEFRTSIVTPNTSITLRLGSMCLFGVSQKILKYLMEGLHQQSLFYLCPAIVFQPNMTTGATHRNLRQA